MARASATDRGRRAAHFVGRLHAGGGVVKGTVLVGLNTLDRAAVQAERSGADLDAVVVPVVAPDRVAEGEGLRAVPSREVRPHRAPGAGVPQVKFEIRASRHQY